MHDALQPMRGDIWGSGPLHSKTADLRPFPYLLAPMRLCPQSGGRSEEDHVMSQILLPPPNTERENATPAAPITSVATSSDSPAYLYEPEPPKRQARFWRMIKWPLRQLIKGIYLTGVFAKRYRLIAGIVLAVLLALAASGFVGYRVLQQQELAREQSSLTASLNFASAPTSSSLPMSVLHFLHARKTYNGQEEWDSLSASLHAQVEQQGGNVSSLQQVLDQARSSGLKFDRFVDSGGFTDPDTGISHYTIEVYAEQGTAHAVLTWFFVVGTDGYISGFQNLTPGQ